jgi:hypothetical protein
MKGAAMQLLRCYLTPEDNIPFTIESGPSMFVVEARTVWSADHSGKRVEWLKYDEMTGWTLDFSTIGGGFSPADLAHMGYATYQHVDRFTIENEVERLVIDPYDPRLNAIDAKITRVIEWQDKQDAMVQQGMEVIKDYTAALDNSNPGKVIVDELLNDYARTFQFTETVSK